MSKSFFVLVMRGGGAITSQSILHSFQGAGSWGGNIGNIYSWGNQAAKRDAFFPVDLPLLFQHFAVVAFLPFNQAEAAEATAVKPN